MPLFRVIGTIDVCLEAWIRSDTYEEAEDAFRGHYILYEDTRRIPGCEHSKMVDSLVEIESENMPEREG